MGSDGGIGECNLPIHVAVGRNLKEGKSLLAWAVENFPGRSICLVHVHQPSVSVSLSNGKLSGSKLKNRAIKAWQEFERLKVQKHINQFLLFLSQMGNQADNVWIEMRSIEQGILQLIAQREIKRLVMGAAPEAFSTKKCKEVNSSKAVAVCQQAPLSCHIWFISKGCLVHERPVDSGSHSTANITSSPSKNTGGTTLACDSKDNVDDNGGKVQYCEAPSGTVEEVEGTVNTNASDLAQTSEYGAPSPLRADSPEHLTCSSSDTPLNTLEKKLRQWRAELDALEAEDKDKAAKSLCEEDIARQQEIEEQSLKQEIETMKNQHAEALKELCLIEDQKPALESRLREASFSEKELEEKIIQAVNLLITFKAKRDELHRERDSAIRRINKYRALRTGDSFGISSAHFFEIPFSDIIEATQNFSPSQKIGEGMYGSVFKGMLNHFKVAIKMLPSSTLQSDREFKNEAEALCRVRHPHLVTLIGFCPESRSLVYEHIENGSLEDYLSSSGKDRPLSWQARIRVAVDICSALLFLQADNNCSVHGNLKPSNILLDGNFVTKISDFGIHNLISQNENPYSRPPFSCKNDPEKFAYVDPESLETGVFTLESDIYSFGVTLLRLLTARPASSVVRDVRWALEGGNLDTLLDVSAGDWPLQQAKQLANLALHCCQKGRLDRPDLSLEVWTVLQPMQDLCNSSQSTPISSQSDSRSQRKIPSHFVCPIYQEVMKDPHIAPDGFTYEGEAIRGWFDSGHQTSPMTNLKLQKCDLLPNYALYYAIQEWLQNT